MDTDTIVYAVIAVVVFAKLWSVLGRRNDGDNIAKPDDPARPRFSPFAPKPVAEEEDEAPFRLEGRGGSGPVQAGALPAVPSALPPLRAAPMSLLGKLEAVKQLDPAFDERLFLADMRQAFSNILEDFSKGDLTRSRSRLGAKVMTHFQAAIDARKTAGETLENALVRIRDTEVTDVKIEGTRVTMSVRYVSDQKNVIRDASGAIVDGADADGNARTEEINDLWNYARDVGQLGSTWQLAETKS